MTHLSDRVSPGGRELGMIQAQINVLNGVAHALTDIALVEKGHSDDYRRGVATAAGMLYRVSDQIRRKAGEGPRGEVTSGREGEELARAIESGDELTEVERLRVVIASKDAQIGRLVAELSDVKKGQK